MLNSLISKHEKNEFLDAVKSSIKDRLSEEIESNKIFEPIVQILNTEGWEYKKIGHSGNTISDFEFTDTKEEYLYEKFNIRWGKNFICWSSKPMAWPSSILQGVFVNRSN